MSNSYARMQAAIEFEDRMLEQVLKGEFDVWIGDVTDREHLRQIIAKTFAAQIWGVFMPSLGFMQETIKVRFSDEADFTGVVVNSPLYVTE